MRTCRTTVATGAPAVSEVMGAGTYGWSFDAAQTLKYYGMWYYLASSGGPANIQLSLWDNTNAVIATTGSVSTAGHITAAWNFVPFVTPTTEPFGTYRMGITTLSNSTLLRDDGIFGLFVEEGQNLVGTSAVETASAYPAAPTTGTGHDSRLYGVDIAFTVPVDTDRWLHPVEHAITSDPVSEDTNGNVRTNVGVLFTVSDRGALLGLRYFCPSFGAGIVTFRLFKRDGTTNGSGGAVTSQHYCYVAPGWNDLTFDNSVVMLDPGVAYVAQVLTVKGYAYTSHGLTTAIDRLHIHLPANGESVASEGNVGVVSTNGRFSTTDTIEAFPDSSFQETSYGVDVLFVPGVRTLFQADPASISANDGVVYTLGTKIQPNVSGRVHGVHWYIPDDGSAILPLDSGLWDFANYSVGNTNPPYRTTLAPYNMLQNHRMGQLFHAHGAQWRDTDTSTALMVGIHTQRYVSTSHEFDAPVSNADSTLTGPINAGYFETPGALQFPGSSFNNGGYWSDILFELIPSGTDEAVRFLSFFSSPIPIG
jgi:hypothetical protein